MTIDGQPFSPQTELSLSEAIALAGKPFVIEFDRGNICVRATGEVGPLLTSRLPLQEDTD